MLLIRYSRPSDAESISTLMTQLQHPSSPNHIRQQLNRIASSPNETVLVADFKKNVVAVLVLQIAPQFHQEPPLARIIDLCVLEGHRGRQIGRRLIERAEKIARQAGCAKLEVTAGNFRQSAHRFYQRNGLEETHRYFAKAL